MFLKYTGSTCTRSDDTGTGLDAAEQQQEEKLIFGYR